MPRPSSPRLTWRASFAHVQRSRPALLPTGVCRRLRDWVERLFPSETEARREKLAIYLAGSCCCCFGPLCWHMQRYLQLCAASLCVKNHPLQAAGGPLWAPLQPRQLPAGVTPAVPLLDSRAGLSGSLAGINSRLSISSRAATCGAGCGEAGSVVNMDGSRAMGVLQAHVMATGVEGTWQAP
jgi:hypothetical protein